MRISIVSLLIGGIALTEFGLCASFGAEADGVLPQREAMQQAFNQGNFKDAYEGFRKLALNADTDELKVGNDLQMAIQCLQRLGRIGEADALIEGVVDVHHDNWRLLWTAAQSYMSLDHRGFIVAGKFERGPRRGGGQGGQPVSSTERDRVRALQLMNQARPLALKSDDRRAAGEFFLSFAQMLLNNRHFHESWRLQTLTDLGELPDYEEGWYHGRSATGAPVDKQGDPILYHVPESFDKAGSDGERWRWCLVEAMEMDASRRDEIRLHFANFLWNQFGVQTMAHYGWWFGRLDQRRDTTDDTGTFELHTLAENETIARLATGIKRFELPEEFNFVSIYESVAEENRSGESQQALRQLGQIFENRRQYPRAAEIWREMIQKHPSQRESAEARLEQIVGNWGRFESASVQRAGEGATIEYRFRNGHAVELTAHRIKVEKLLADVKDYLKSSPGRLDHRKVNIGNIGHRLVRENETQYIGEKVADWQLIVRPRPAHFDKRVTANTPLQQPGAYLLKAKMHDGNTSQVIIWVADTAILKKPLNNKSLYYLADAVDGRPVAGANVEFFGFRQEHVGKRRGPRNYRVIVKNFAEKTGDDGQITLDANQQPTNHQWLIIARTDDGRFAYLGFSHVWYNNYYDREYNATKVYTITDRPVYRPSQEVHYKFWIRHAKYDKEDTSDFAGRQFTVEIYDPKNDRVVQKSATADEYGGIEGSWSLPDDATLGVYRVQIEHQGGGQFRVEEYKKPEYEVKVDAPDEPVMLGEKVTATIEANYYFGAPVTEAKVKYKVERTAHSETWYPAGPWDWLYGKGYWWFGYDCPWYPGWRRWGHPAPVRSWWPGRGHTPPELVAEQEVEIGADGKIEFEIDTKLAKLIHGDQDHRYTITAEVTDQSRRTIVGTGSVLVARQPFEVTAWVDRGYYRVGDTIQSHFAARTLDGKPVEGEGKLRLMKIDYEDGEAKETAVAEWDVDADQDGRASMKLKASESGQYRLSYTVTDSGGHKIEGGYLFTIIGAGFDGGEFKFNDIEVIADKSSYEPGEKVRLMINTNRAGAAVLLFVRPANGIYLPPKLLRLEGKSTTVEVEVTKKDMPNFFVEAVTVAGADVHTAVREIYVPPEKRVLSVDVEPSAATYRPGEKAKVKVKLTDFFGEPFVGSTVVAIYDKSVEYISGGSNVADIKEFFWKWRRSHRPQTEHNLSRHFGNLVEPNKPHMQNLGVFGATVAEEMSEVLAEGGAVMQGGALGGMGGKAFGRGMARRKAGMALETNAVADAAPMAMAEEANMAPAAAAPANNAKKAADKPGQAGAAMVEPTVRKQFADTALWVGALETAKDGTAEVELDMPENLTTWRIKVWGMGHGTKVGEGQTDVITRKDLILRMQTPRFFVETDEVVLSANVHNYLDNKKQVQAVLELEEGGPLAPMADDLQRTVEIEADGEARIDWRVRVVDEGEAVVRMKALTDEESDAMEMTLPSYVHGMLKMESFSGALRPDDEQGRIVIDVPEKRRPKQSRLEVRYSPTLAGAMVDALPYLVDYPYGCTEQTLSRFLPTVITQKILLDMRLDLEEIRKKRTNLNAQEIGKDWKRARQWKRYDRNPVFEVDAVRRMTKEGVQRLTEMQLSDGGWGWFSGWGEQSYPHTTAYVVHGLQLAKHNDVAVVPGVIERGVQWLKNYQDEQVQKLENALEEPKKRPWKEQASNVDTFVYMVLVDAGEKNDRMFEFLYRDRTKLSLYAVAMIGLAAEKQGKQDELAMILENLSQYVVEDDENQTAWLKMPGGYWWYWYGSEIETHAYYLKLLARTDPKGELASRLVKYLLNNRKHATYWNSTRDTAICIEAMAEFLRASGEAEPEMTVEVWVDGQMKQAVEITAKNLFRFDNKFVLVGNEVTSGEHTVELRKRGAGPLYYNAYLTNFTLEDFIEAAGLEIKVHRDYYRLKRVDKTVEVAGSRGQVVDQKVEKYERVALENLDTLESGDLVEIELVIESKNDYEYLVFEDMKPAGFEPVELRSGYNGNNLGAYVEFRDNRVVFFVSRLARGKHSVAYRMRAEIPGKFSALPTKGWAMYAPELKGNSNEIKLKVED